MSTSVLKALPGKLDIKRHSPSIVYLSSSSSQPVDHYTVDRLQGEYSLTLTPLGILQTNPKLSHDMLFPTMWYVRPAKPQISLRIRAV